MKLAIMQPYFLPYIGYFQLMASVDRFVIYDDVNYIKRGWVNRNRIKVQQEPHMLTIPLQNAGRDVLICDVLMGAEKPVWSKKLLRTVSLAYAKAPYFEKVFAMLEAWLQTDTPGISQLNTISLTEIRRYIGLETVIIPSSTIYGNRELKAGARLLDICAKEQASTYINAPGGRELYTQAQFQEHGVELYFVHTDLEPYPQGKGDFIPGLSILDIMMWNSPDAIRTMATDYKLER